MEAHQPVTSIIKALDILDLSFERVRAFRAKQPANDSCAFRPCGQQCVKIGAAADDAKLIGSLFFKAIELPCLVERPFIKVVPGAGGPALDHQQPMQNVRSSFITLVILPGRYFGHGGENLKCHITLCETRQVHMAAR